MKREDHFGRIVVFLAALFFVVIILPAMIAGGSGQLEAPVSHGFSNREESVVLIPGDGWTIQNAAVEADSGLVLEEEAGTGNIAVACADLAEGGAGSVHFLCRRQTEKGDVNVGFSYTISRDQDGSVTVRAYPDRSELLNVNYVYTYEAEQV